MSDNLYIVEKEKLDGIAKAIMTKRNRSEGLTVDEMEPEILNIQTGGNQPQPLSITKNGSTYSSPNGYSPVTVDVPAFQTDNIEHVVNGKWVCPDDWDDVETLALPEEETEQVLYLVYRTDLPVCWISWGFNSGAYRYQKGHVVDGEFVATTESVNKNSGTYVQEFIESDFETSGKNTIVYKFLPVNYTIKLTGTRNTNWTVNGVNSYSGGYQPMVMRYGQLYYATQIGGNAYSLECDNVRNCKSLTSCSGIYGIGNGIGNGICNLKKHRHSNWDTSKVTTFNGMFNCCRNLVDCDTDFSGWVTDKCTYIGSMFQYCWMLNGEINLSNWNTSNVTTIGGMFRECFNITKLKGIETWYLPKCSNGCDSTFIWCINLYQNDEGYLDLSNWHLSEAATANGSKASMFQYCHAIRKLNIQNFNFEKTNSINSMFAYMRSVKEIDMRNIVPITSICTNCGTLFGYNYQMDNILYDGDGLFYNWDFSSVTTMGNILTCCMKIKSLKFGTPINGKFAGSTTNSTFSGLFTATYSLEEIDMSEFDISNFTYNQLTQWFTQGNLNFKEFYPPQGINNNFMYNFSFSISKESLLRIIDALAPQTSAKTLTLGAVNKARLTEEEIAVATQKGWTVA